MDAREAINVLSEFNQRVEQISDYRLGQLFIQGGAIQYSLTEPPDDNVYGLKREDVDAFVLNIRLFYQESDGVSLNRIGQVYNQGPISSTQSKAYNDVRRDLKDYLQTPSMFEIDGKRRTHEEYFKLFLFGYMAHFRYEGNNSASDEYLEVMSNPLSAMFASSAFNQVLHRYFKALRDIRQVNSATISELQNQLPTSV